MTKRKFSKKELAYIVINILGTEDKDISKELGLTESIDELKEMIDDIPNETIQELNSYDNSDFMIENYSTYSESIDNPFMKCIKENYDKFFNGLLGGGKETKLQWKQTCKELLVESVKIYSTPYKKEYYLKDNEKLIYIGNNYESYLENLYSMIDFQYTTLIPFSSFINTIKNLRLYDELEPNRDYILFKDCLLNVNTGETIDKQTITVDTVPYAVIDYNYLQENKEVQEYIFELFERIDSDNLIKSLMYGMFNKRVLKKTSAIFNIQKSNMGKTLIVTPFTEIGLFRNVNHEMLKGNDKAELFKQYYTIVFEEIQEKIINGSGFNSLIDNTSMAVQRKYKEAITVPKELKPVVYINGESMPNFKGRTKGSFNRFVFIPNYKEPLTEKDYEYLTENAMTVGVEIIRHLINYMKTVSKEVIKDNILNARKTEKEIFELKENKVNIIFEYIKQEPFIKKEKEPCITETILIEIIKELQAKGNITVDLFNSDTSIRQFIRQIIIPSIETNIDPKETTNKRIKKGTNWKTAELKYILQLTEKGKTIVTDLGYKISSLEC